MSPADSPRADDYTLPLIIGVTGHRDLSSEEIPGIRDRVRSLFTKLQEEYPSRRLRVMSPLAEGADRLVASEALKMDIDLFVPLPMPRANYVDDFDTAESRAEFDALCDQASVVIELPASRGSTPEGIALPGAQRDRQYAQLGVFLCAHCHILLALWDGKHGDNVGGTGQVVKFHHDNFMHGYTPKTIATQQMLVDDESDLVYHIVCSRDCPNGEPQEGMQPLDCSWFTKDRLQPRSEDIPPQHRLVFSRSSEFSRDALQHAELIESGKFPLLSDDQQCHLPPGIGAIDHVFCIADVLAIVYQKKTLMVLRATHFLAFMMGFMFILYSDVDRWPWYMFAFLFFFVIAAGAQLLAKRSAWHRKYLDYRALAEGLRVQFYLAAAGATNDSVSKFTHDNFLQTQDPELGWIRNVMRVAGLRCDAEPNKDRDGLTFAVREWIGGDNTGQLGYFWKKLEERKVKTRYTEFLGQISLATSVLVVVLFILAAPLIPPYLEDPLLGLMGTMLLLFAVRHGYAHATAEKELIKQYDFMLRIFRNARRRLDQAKDVDEQRQVLLALGGSALDEHAEWILMHRERSIDQSEIWRMGS